MKEKMQKTGSFGKNMCLALFDRVKVSWVNKKKMFSKILFFQGVRNSIFFRVCLKTSSIIKSFPVQISRESTRLFFNIFIIFPTLTKNQEKKSHWGLSRREHVRSKITPESQNKSGAGGLNSQNSDSKKREKENREI